MKNVIHIALMVSLGLMVQNSFAGSATWKVNPSSNEWITAANWTPATVPNGPDDVATFDASNQTIISLLGGEVNSVVFAASASAFTLSSGRGGTFTVSGNGIINNSGVQQSFLFFGLDYNSGYNTNTLSFTNTATVGNLIQLTAESGRKGEQFDGEIQFSGSSSAGSSTITVYGAGALNGGLIFHDSSSAGSSTISVNSSETYGGSLHFHETSTAGNATITNNSGAVTTFGDSTDAANSTIYAQPGMLEGGHAAFYDSSMAGAATIIVNGGSNGEVGGSTEFWHASDASHARVMVLGNGWVRVGDHDPPGATLGSLEGDGIVTLEGVYAPVMNLNVGTNNRSTIFAGTIEDNGLGGSVTKLGSGKLSLAGANTYTGGTTLNGGTLLVSNTTGSGLGSGPVQALSGILGGTGVISGRVTMGTGRGSGVTLGPGSNSVIPGTLTIGKQLVLKADATYRVTINSRTPAVDLVVANGIRVIGAQIVFNEVNSAALPPGTTFAVISNTSSKGISGRFGNLPDGGTVTIGSNTFQANYEGGDGNDLTLTVIP